MKAVDIYECQQDLRWNRKAGIYLRTSLPFINAWDHRSESINRWRNFLWTAEAWSRIYLSGIWNWCIGDVKQRLFLGNLFMRSNSVCISAITNKAQAEARRSYVTFLLLPLFYLMYLEQLDKSVMTHGPIHKSLSAGLATCVCRAQHGELQLGALGCFPAQPAVGNLLLQGVGLDTQMSLLPPTALWVHKNVFNNFKFSCFKTGHKITY